MMRFALIAALLCAPAHAETVTVRHDAGGSLVDRLAAIQRLRSAGSRVVIAGACYSSCTMLIGLPGACVKHSARLGFHGPQSQYYGVSLPPAEFDQWSLVMANHYPEKIGTWFMQTGRDVVLGMTVLSGSQAIAMGARDCGVAK